MKSTFALVPSREIVRVPFSVLSRDEENYRKKFSPEGLEELGLSIYEEGIIQNLECGPDGRVHLGNRRIEALSVIVIPRLEREIAELAEFETQPNWAELAGVTDPAGRLADLRARLADRELVPVRVLSAEEVKDAKIRQIVENLQREGVSARDEAEGYARLLEEVDAEGKPRWTTESIAKRIGKGLSAQYVANRLKLLRAPKEALDALDAGEIPVRIAEMIGRVPNEATRREVAKQVLKPKFSDKPLTEKETADLIRKDYMISLQKATFDQEDLELVPGAGGCKGCQYRSGNDKSIEADLAQPGWKGAKGGHSGASGKRAGISPDLCTNPACFRAKCDAAWTKVAAAAEKEGFDILPAGEAEKIFSRYDGSMGHNAAWLDLDEKPDYEWTGTFDSKGKAKWRSILKDSGIRITKARDPVSGRVHDLVRKGAAKEAVRLMLEQAKTAPAPEVTGSGKATGKPVQVELFAEMAKKVDRDKAARDEAALARLEAKIAQAQAIAGVDAMLDALTSPAEGPLDREVMYGVLETTLSDTAEACAFVALWLELERPFAGASGRDYLPSIMEHFRGREVPYTERELFALIVLATMAGNLKWQGIKGATAKRFAKLLEVDLDAIGKKARTEYLRKEKERKGGKKKDKETRGGGEVEMDPPAKPSDVATIRNLFEKEPAMASAKRADVAFRLGWTRARTNAAIEAAVGSAVKNDGETWRLGEWETAPPAPVSLLGDDNPEAAANERLLIVLEVAIQTSDLESIEVSFVAERIPIGLGFRLVALSGLWSELVARGVIDDEGKVLEIPGWRKDAVGNRRANAYYEAQLEAGAEISIPMVEERFGLKDKALATYRKNQNRGKGGE